ncbi:hypothetical protein PMAYCL1PPCAC_32212 [Pristionchus mayeri]|uniref:Innexin n=1 Tax=Pristionchus mayeri TaxID=1317129 RepID=A0AAN5DH95_9BILA|nr:hypothetical protein PMAYCL1PPCAC_32212 [Pristionchus mayeri]
MLGVPFLERALSGWLRPHSLDDPVDRLNYFVTTMLLVFFGIMVSAKQYVGSPIQCWTPMEFRGGWEQYAEDYCFIQNTFYVPMEDEIPSEHEEREKAEIGYYQWVPIVLALQAIMFYIPNWIWKTLNKQTGIDIENAVTDAQKMRALPAIARKVEAEKLSEYLYEALNMSYGHKKPNYYRFFCFRFGNNLGSYVSSLYIATKLVGDLMNGREWHESGIFPRVTLCDFAVRKLANMHRYTVQCVLMINMFNEKIYLFLWSVALICNECLCYSICICYQKNSVHTIWQQELKKCLQLKSPNEMHDHRENQMINRFAIAGLQPDGVLVMRFIEGHAGAMVAKDVAVLLYKKFLDAQMILANTASTQSTSPGFEGPHETLYNPEKPGFHDDGARESLFNPEKVAIMQPDYKH